MTCIPIYGQFHFICQTLRYQAIIETSSFLFCFETIFSIQRDSKRSHCESKAEETQQPGKIQLSLASSCCIHFSFSLFFAIFAINHTIQHHCQERKVDFWKEKVSFVFGFDLTCLHLFFDVCRFCDQSIPYKVCCR